ncbi:MAG TPA: hypothetical protein VJN02_00245 [Gammaproteobacteria bacterium]|nr:hypothetical protein [Gammaproteobacteria bacterium]
MSLERKELPELEAILSNTRRNIIEMLKKIIDAFSVNDFVKLSKSIDEGLKQLYHANDQIKQLQVKHTLTKTDNTFIEQNKEGFTKIQSFLNGKMQDYLQANDTNKKESKSGLLTELKDMKQDLKKKDLKSDDPGPKSSGLRRQ